MTLGPRPLLAASFLALQLGLVVHAQFTSRRYFCWAPNDYANTYTLRVKINGTDLTQDQLLARYHLQGRRFSYENPATHIMDTVRQYEQTYGRDQHAEVSLEWSLNGHPTQSWQWPEEK
jgi:hypothetical protein